jgi:hypothetical protein
VKIPDNEAQSTCVALLAKLKSQIDLWIDFVISGTYSKVTKSTFTVWEREKTIQKNPMKLFVYTDYKRKLNFPHI